MSNVMRTMVMCGVMLAGCASAEKSLPVSLHPHRNTCEVIIQAPPEVGNLRLWVPEGIMSETGCSAVYPLGSEWERIDKGYRHTVAGPGTHGPGNVIKVDANTFECIGIRMPIDEPVRWETEVRDTSGGVEFAIRLTNEGDRTIQKASAAICLKFLAAPWWADRNVYTLSNDEIRTLEDLGREAGDMNDSFQAYLLQGETYDHEFYHKFWGINDDTLDAPVMVSENPEEGVSVVITTEHAYFLHSNKGNPCTDIMLAYGDLEPGQTRERVGYVRIVHARAREILERYRPEAE